MSPQNLVRTPRLEMRLTGLDNTMYSTLWAVLMSVLLTNLVTSIRGIPFTPPKPTPYATPRILKPHTTPGGLNSLNGFLWSIGNNPGACQASIPILARNVSCNQGNFRRLDLSDAQLKRVLREEGGNYVSDYMAATDQEAQSNFKNLVSLNDVYEDADKQSHPEDWGWDYQVTKRSFLTQLESVYQEYYGHLPDTTDYPDHSTTGQQYDMARLARAKQKFDKSTKHVGSQGADHPVQSDDLWREAKVNIPLHVLAKVLPVRYLYPEEKRTRRFADGSTSQKEYCRNPGAQTRDGYYFLCSSCAHTTTLGQNVFPRIINEVWCNTDSKGCLHVGDTAHGSCRQNVFYMTMLRKKMNSCMVVLKDGVQYLTQEWEKYAQSIKVGCNCLIDKRSPFVKYVTPSGP